MVINRKNVKEIFDYHPDGYLTWKVKFAKRIEIGRRVGHPENREGGARNMFKIRKKHYYCSRVIFLYHKGYLPKSVDHKDRDKLNDKIENLRAASLEQNSRNTTPRKNSTSKYLGVYLAHGKYWNAAIRVNKKTKYLGSFKTEEEAAIAYNVAAKIYHKEFANLNVIIN